ncbi:MAG: multicopper oxidase family protein, partial [Pseudomonas sp.]
PFDLELVPGHITPAWGYGGQAPGVELRCRQGERLRVRFINKLEQPTTIHWHGIRLPLEMDGVPYVSQLPVLPGEYFDYNFITPDAGSYWYHPHTTSSEQLGRGLVGPLIIEEREPTGFRHERTLSLKTWHVDEEGAFTAFSVPREAAREGTRGRLTTINAVPNPTLELPAGQVVRLRLLNLDNTVTYRLNLPGGEARIYALDGNPVEPRPLGKDYWLGPGMRIDLALKVPAAGVELSLRNGPLRLATLKGVASSEAPGEWPAALPANPVAEPDLAQAETLRFNFEWTAALAPESAQGGRAKYWQINGQAWDINDKTCADRPIANLKLGNHYIFVLRNMAQYQHPIHLHGLSFKVLDSDRKSIIPYFTDTYLLGKNETARIAFVADNPGVWMFHCHVIDHMETGLMAAISVA